ncbi:MAG: hypothetical protein LBS74_02190 [Oscillospiraceae bacterium]|nr:hypothetical protein [Oscillospiraceae bacterium]
MGKSTMLKHYFVDAICKRERIPILVELNRLPQYKNNLFDCMYDSLKRFNFTLDEEHFKYALNSGCFILMFDAFDEAPDGKSVFEQLERLCDEYSKNYFIVTTRPMGSYNRWHRFDMFEALPFTKTQAYNVIKRIKYDDKELQDKFLKEMNKTLYNKHKSFASIPLMLNIMMLTYKDYSEIPTKIHIFYKNAYAALYRLHDSNKGGGFVRSLKCGLSSDEFKKAIMEFCFCSFAKGMYAFNLGELEGTIAKVSLLKDVDPYDFIEDLRTAVCLIQQDGQNYYEFTHRSFQEYFTALYLKENDTPERKWAIRLIEKTNISQIRVIETLCDMDFKKFERNVAIPMICSILDNQKNNCTNNDTFRIYDLDFFIDNYSNLTPGYGTETFCLDVLRNSYNFDSMPPLITAKFKETLFNICKPIVNGFYRCRYKDFTATEEMRELSFGENGFFTNYKNYLINLREELLAKSAAADQEFDALFT